MVLGATSINGGWYVWIMDAGRELDRSVLVRTTGEGVSFAGDAVCWGADADCSSACETGTCGGTTETLEAAKSDEEGNSG